MAKSKQSFGKKEREKKLRKKKKAKLERKLQRKKEKAENGPKSFEDMLSYVDENGNLSSTPPDPSKKKVFKADEIVLGIPPKDKSEEDPIRKGKVKFFNYEKGYGFITDDQTKESVFVHMNNTVQQINENDHVSYELEMGPKGLNAINVAPITSEK